MKKFLISTNPAKDSTQIGTVEISTPGEIQEKVNAAQKAKRNWKEVGVRERIRLLRILYQELIRKRDEISLMVTREIGKPITESNLEFDFYINYFKWFLDNGERVLGDKVTFEDEKTIHSMIYEPYGVAAVITPWNFPFGMFCWGVISNLIAGNTVVWKTSKECPLTGKIVEDVVYSVKLPEGVFSEIYGTSEEGNVLVHSDIDFIWFTGSTEVGKKLYKLAAEKLIWCVLEMGGSNPAIVFEDADIGSIVTKIYIKKYKNCGQTCDALKRLIVHRSVVTTLVEKLKKELESKKIGDPEDPKTDFGPLVNKTQLELLKFQVQDALQKGAKIVIGRKGHTALSGFYFKPNILTGVTKNMRIWNEEVFGPVLTVIPFETEGDAITLANDTEYGLGSIIFTKDKEKALRVANQIEAGTVEINSASHWLTCNPFGGYKHSGIGREHGEEGLRELTQIKVISIEK